MYSRILSLFLLVTILVAGSAILCSAGNGIDSLKVKLRTLPRDTQRVAVLNELAYQLVSNDPVEAVDRASEAIALSKKLEFPLGIAEGYSQIALAYKLLSRNDSSFHYYRLSLQEYRKTSFIEGQVNVLNNIGMLFARLGVPDSAAHYLFESLNMAESANHLESQSFALANIGLIFHDQQRYDEAIEYLTKALRIIEKNGNKKNLAMAFENLANSHLAKEDFKIAGDYYDRAYKTYMELGEKRSIARIHVNRSEYFRLTGKFREALEDAMLSADLYRQTRNPNGSIYANMAGAKALEGLGQYTASRVYAMQALDTAIAISNKQMELESNQFLQESFFKAGDYRSAYFHLQKAEMAEDSIFNEKNAALLNNLKTLYETEKKENQITLLSKDKELAIAGVKREKTIRNSILMGAVLILVIGVLLFNRYRIMQQNRQQSERMRISHDLHDEVGSTLSSIGMVSSFVAGQMDSTNNAGTVRMVEEIASSARQMGEDMNDIIWAINPENDHFESVINRLKNFASRISESRNIQLDFKFEQPLLNCNFSMESRKNLFLICKEAINNSVKYSGCGNLKVYFSNPGRNILRVMVSDDGIGFNPETVSEGNGIRNIKHRAILLNAELEIVSEPGKGTSVNLEMATG